MNPIKFEVHPIYLIFIFIFAGAIFFLSGYNETEYIVVEKNVEKIQKISKENLFEKYPDFPFYESQIGEEPTPIKEDGNWWVYDRNLGEFIRKEW
jgi:hypothetical protein